MKNKLILITLCLAAVMLLFASCKGEEQGNDDNGNQNQSQSCIHSYTEGICVHCGKIDPNFKPDDSENGENPDEEQTPDDNENKPTVPPINMGDETELPFVPAK